jgi:hypothetical protein
MDWVGRCKNSRDEFPRAGGGYAWDIEKVFQKGTIVGHCMSYAEVLATAAQAMGFTARHMCMIGFRQTSHEVCEIWIPSLGKWVYFDPSLTTYYIDKETRAPMNMVEMHRVVVEKFLGQEEMSWWIQRNPDLNAPQKIRVREVGGKEYIDCRLGRWKYGEPMPADYDWGWRHGYLTAGYIQMTPRNDFHSRPDKASRRFGTDPGYDGFPNWVDEKTPPAPRGTNYTRPRDFYWTLDQAGLKLVRTGDDEIAVELGHSMPFFAKYRIEQEAQTFSAESRMVWKLKSGVNRLTVRPVDEFGKEGLPSTVAVRLDR